MSVLFVLISISILVAAAFLILFIWAVRSGQFDDTETPSIRMLFEDRKQIEKPENQEPRTENQ